MRFIVILISVFAVSACFNEKVIPRENVSLKQVFQPHFTFGSALGTKEIYAEVETTDSLIRYHFNSIVAENCMKSERIHPEKDRYYWKDADAFIDFGERNKMEIIGHTLAWHSQTPDWFFVDANGEDVGREEMLERLKDHISTILMRYKGKIKGWDVVNEAINDDGSMRNSKFLQIIGKDWVEQAFRFAYEADPDVELYYNDYNLSNPVKREAVYEMLKNIQSKEIKVSGVGMQGHVNINDPSIQDIEKSIVRFSDLGIVMITELDVTVLPWPEDGVTADVSLSVEFQEEMNPYPSGLSDSMKIVLNDRFLNLFNVFLKHSDKIDRVTMWGVNDAQTWRNDWPIKGRNDYPLLFNRDNSPKAVVDSLLNIMK